MTDKEAMAMAIEALESCTPQDTSTGHVIHAWHDEELVNGAIAALKERVAQRTEQNFCSRCGKRTPDSTHIHTCTPPPQEGT